MNTISSIRQFFVGYFDGIIDSYWDYIEYLSTPGVIPPKVPLVRFIMKILLWFWLNFQLGRIEIVGKEFLNSPERTIFIANHSSYFDALIIHFVMRRYTRFMTAMDQFVGLCGLRAIVLTAGGSFAVDKSKGGDVINPAIELIKQGGTMMIFPEGQINSDGAYSKFKTGAARIALGAYEALGKTEPVHIVPMHLCYRRRHIASAQGGYGKMGLKWRGGVVLTLGPAIITTEDEDRKTLTARLEEWVTSQTCDFQLVED